VEMSLFSSKRLKLHFVLFSHLGWNWSWLSIFSQTQAVAMSESLRFFSTSCRSTFHQWSYRLIESLTCAKPVIPVYQPARKYNFTQNIHCGNFSTNESNMHALFTFHANFPKFFV
jgi:hypothetical protein